MILIERKKKQRFLQVCESCGDKRVVYKRCRKCAPKPKKIKTVRKVVFAECQDLWRKCVYEKARYRSEYSGQFGTSDNPLQPHHIYRKSCYRLRFGTDNGYALTLSEHIFDMKDKFKRDKIEQAIKDQRGQDIFERLRILKKCKGGDLALIRFRLIRELRELRELEGG